MFRRVRLRFASCYKILFKLALIIFIVCWLLYYNKVIMNPNYNNVKRKLSSASKNVSEEKDQKEKYNYGRNLLLVDALHPGLFETKIQIPHSHHLENFCKYPVLQPEDLNIAGYIEHRRQLNCKQVFPDIVRFSDGVLTVNQELALKSYNSTVNCSYRSLSGTLRPKVYALTFPTNRGTWFGNRSSHIPYSQFQVRCYLDNDVQVNNTTKPVYKEAFAHIGTDQRNNFTKSDEDHLSIDIIGLDSTSLNMFRRHMPKTWNYFIEEMKAFHLEGYNKVADNSIVNWLPTFTGMRYGNQSDDMPCEFSEYEKPLNFERVPFIWNEFRDLGCVTMMNDDPMHFTRGLFHYPWKEALGFRKKPTYYYFRPWHVYQRRQQETLRKQRVDGYTEFCFKNEPYYKLQMKLVQQWIEKYKDTCHFSFSFFTDITHNDPNNLELMDNVVLDMLRTAFIRNQLNNTVLILMADHGHRVAGIQYSFIGRIEERAPFFGIYFPKWFRDKYPKIVENLKYNKNRLTSNYDIYQTLKDIVDSKFDHTRDERAKGISLFQKIPTDRSCASANIPENHCLCMENLVVPHRLTPEQLSWANTVIFEYTKNKLKLFPKCHLVLNIRILAVVILTTNKMIKHGVRDQTPEFLANLKNSADETIYYYQIDYQLLPTNVTAVIRLQHDKKHKKLFVNVDPLLISNVDHCSMWSNLANFCACMSFAQGISEG